jgi:hypothetical protein
MAFEDVVERNPVDSGGFHGHCGDTATHQPLGHLLQVGRKCWENSYRVFIAVSRHGNKDLPCADVDTCRIRLQNGAVVQRHPLSSSAPVLAGASVLLSGLSRLLLLTGHGIAFLLRQRPDRAK